MNKKRHFELSADTANKREGQYCFFPLPQTNEYQNIDNLTSSPKSKQIIEDKEWNNKVAIFGLNDVKEIINISFNHIPKIINKSINEQWTCSSYSYLFLQKNSQYLTSNKFIDGNAPEIIRIINTLIGKETHLLIIVQKIFNYVLQHLSYGKPIDGLYSYKQAIGEKVTDCGGFSTLLLSLFQSLNIPGRLVVGYVIKQNTLTDVIKRIPRYTLRDLNIHAWAEIMLPNGEWFPLDPSIEWQRTHGLTKRRGGFGFIPDDRLVVSFGQDFDISIQKKTYHVDLLQKPVIY